jgi:hypothetical protein
MAAQMDTQLAASKEYLWVSKKAALMANCSAGPTVG